MMFFNEGSLSNSSRFWQSIYCTLTYSAWWFFEMQADEMKKKWKVVGEFREKG